MRVFDEHDTPEGPDRQRVRRVGVRRVTAWSFRKQRERERDERKHEK